MTAKVRRHVDKQTKIDVCILPGGTTSHLQPVDVSWNKPSKAAYHELYNQWMASGKQFLTHAGNMRPPDKLTCLKWVVKAWEVISTEVRVSSFKASGISVEVDGSEDSSIHCLKQGGVAAGVPSNISQLTAEMLAAPDVNDNDPFLSVDDDEDELETNELTVEDMD